MKTAGLGQNNEENKKGTLRKKQKKKGCCVGRAQYLETLRLLYWHH